jgi:hypothetical protein
MMMTPQFSRCSVYFNGGRPCSLKYESTALPRRPPTNNLLSPPNNDRISSPPSPRPLNGLSSPIIRGYFHINLHSTRLALPLWLSSTIGFSHWPMFQNKAVLPPPGHHCWCVLLAIHYLSRFLHTLLFCYLSIFLRWHSLVSIVDTLVHEKVSDDCLSSCGRDVRLRLCRPSRSKQTHFTTARQPIARAFKPDACNPNYSRYARFPDLSPNTRISS